MKSVDLYPTFEAVSDAIGDKVVAAMFAAVAKTRLDLAEYRAALPHFVATSSERGLANWIHDRLWLHAVSELDSLPEVTIFDNGVTREIHCGTEYRFRAKRHDEASNVQSYPTQAALEFHVQPVTFDGMQELKLDFGYRWDAELRDVGPAVMSFRHRNDLIWSEIIPGDAQTGTLALGSPSAPLSGPGVSVDVAGKKQEEAQTP